MIGLIPKLLLDMVVTLKGEKASQEVKKKANIPIDQVYQMNASCPDEDWQKLFASTIEVLEIPAEVAEVDFANYFFNHFVHLFPTWFDMYHNSYDYLSSHFTTHNFLGGSTVDPTAADALQAKFEIVKLPQKLITFYKSSNKNCILYNTFSKNVIDHYRDEAQIEETKCMKRGDDCCQISMTWTKLKENT